MIFGKYPKDINQSFANKLAQVLFGVYADDTMTIVIGKDNRPEAKELEKTLADVFMTLGANVFLLGITSTAGVSFGVRSYKATFGVYITGGHKPKSFIGFKIINGNGYAITDEQLSHVTYLFKNMSLLTSKSQKGSVYLKPYFNNEFALYLKQFSAIKPQNSIKILVDFAGGAGQEIYEEIFEHLGIVPFLSEDSFEINKTFLRLNKSPKTKFLISDFYGKKNKKNFFDYKIVFSGDCEKIIVFDSSGKKIETEKLLALFVLAKGQKVAVTNLFSNQAVIDYLQLHDVKVEIAQSFGEKEIVNKMLATNACLGGDSFGNLLFLQQCKVSCAFLTLIEFLSLWCVRSNFVKEVLEIPVVPSAKKVIKVSKNFDMQKFELFMLDCQNMIKDSGKVLATQDKFENTIILHVESTHKHLINQVLKFANNFEGK